MDWRENADTLRKRMKEAMAGGIERMAALVPQEVLTTAQSSPAWMITMTDYTGCSPEFKAAHKSSSRRDMSPLADYLALGKALGPEEREKLARMLPKKQDGRPRNNQIRGATDIAWAFYRVLRDMNKESGVSDWGHCDDMKCYAARVAAEDWFGYDLDVGRMRSEEELEVLAGQIREFMDKSKSRRGGGEKAIVCFPVPQLAAKTRG